MAQIDRIEMDLYTSMGDKYLLKFTKDDVHIFDEEFFITFDFIRVYFDIDYFKLHTNHRFFEINWQFLEKGWHVEEYYNKYGSLETSGFDDFFGTFKNVLFQLIERINH